jgi:ribosomal protein L2
LILIKKYKKIIPSFRHKKNINIFDNSFFFFKSKKNTYKKNFIKKYKQLYKIKNIQVNLFKQLNIVTQSYVYNFKPIKKFVICKTYDDNNIIIPGIEFINIGKVLYDFKNININKFFFRGFISSLMYIPSTIIVSNVSNNNNNKITFAKSAGSFCKIKKIKKTKKKLILLELPSTKEISLNKNSKCYIGKNVNFKKKELIEGKFGFGFNYKKKIAVRGVAMNPVDHPNGGRTKTVKPEKSP